MQAISKMTSKYQATIPMAVREALGLAKGDAVAFEVNDGRVSLRRATPVDLVYAKGLQSTLGEWDSPADDQAYANL
jgi:antitoxin PrlF